MPGEMPDVRQRLFFWANIASIQVVVSTGKNDDKQDIGVV